MFGSERMGFLGSSHKHLSALQTTRNRRSFATTSVEVCGGCNASCIPRTMEWAIHAWTWGATRNRRTGATTSVEVRR
jgi:Ribonuclease G/E